MDLSSLDDSDQGLECVYSLGGQGQSSVIPAGSASNASASEMSSTQLTQTELSSSPSLRAGSQKVGFCFCHFVFFTLSTSNFSLHSESYV